MKIADKIVTKDQAQQIAEEWRQSGYRVVFTNGCFDILHRGHIDYLEKAAAMGQKLVVGINSDASTSRLKGPTRPINNQDSRAYLMASLTFVDLVTIFEEDTPLNLIHAVNPHTLVKGGDYQADDVVGSEFVRKNGGDVAIVAFVEGFSTSSIESRILAMQNRTAGIEEE